MNKLWQFPNANFFFFCQSPNAELNCAYLPKRAPNLCNMLVQARIAYKNSNGWYLIFRAHLTIVLPTKLYLSKNWTWMDTIAANKVTNPPTPNIILFSTLLLFFGMIIYVVRLTQFMSSSWNSSTGDEKANKRYSNSQVYCLLTILYSRLPDYLSY